LNSQKKQIGNVPRVRPQFSGDNPMRHFTSLKLTAAIAAAGFVLAAAGSAFAVTPEDMTASVTVTNNYASTQNMLSYSVSGTIAPTPVALTSGDSVVFFHTQSSTTSLSGRITYSRCRFNWSIIKTADTAYTFSAAVNNTSSCTVVSTPNYNTGYLEVVFTIKK
jgi:hypothetical protein